MIPAETVAHIKMIAHQYIGAYEMVCRDFLADPATGYYKHPLWDMVRELKDDRYMASQPGYLAIPIIHQVIGGVTELGYGDLDEAVDDLEVLWDKVVLAFGEDPLDAAVGRQNADPVRIKTKRLAPTYKLLVGIAYHLQALQYARGHDHIALPVVRMGAILDVSPHRVSDFIGFAVEEGFLRLAEEYVRPMNGRHGIANKFSFTGVLEDGVVSGLAPEFREPVLVPSRGKKKHCRQTHEFDPSCSS